MVRQHHMTTADKSQYIYLKEDKQPMNKGTIHRLTEEGIDVAQNVGGAVPKGYAIIDCDSAVSGEQVKMLNQHLGIKDNSYATTKGRHYVYKIGSDVKGRLSANTQCTVLDDVDIRADGKGYVMLKRSGKGRVEPSVFEKMLENAPDLPMSLAVTDTMKIKLKDYQEGSTHRHSELL